MRSIHVLSRETDAFTLRLQRVLAHFHQVGSLAELRDLLAAMPAPEGPEPAVLDLMGHSTTAAKLLRLGKSVVDMYDWRVQAYFERLARDRILPRLGVVAVRLLGCETAVEVGGQHTVRRLASTLGVRVYGSKKALMKSHYSAGGFDPHFAHILVEAAQVPSANQRRIAAERLAG
jgi:hypothetical protein